MLALREELRQDPAYCGLDSAVEYGSIFLCNVRDPGLFVFPTHRVLHSLPGIRLADAACAARECFFDRGNERSHCRRSQGRAAKARSVVAKLSLCCRADVRSI